MSTRARTASTRQPPVILLAQEHEHLHRLPRLGHTLCFGQTRKVDRQVDRQRGRTRSTRSRTS